MANSGMVAPFRLWELQHPSMCRIPHRDKVELVVSLAAPSIPALSNSVFTR